ncbi:hypothetical protein [Nocardia noduli]|uniref:hypothetical protein n=1 Tax=Nocardia noduli TaxID=2815722 RepID=UPI001C2161C3|nr:hypothetical protein [Nocardia noduli]
MNTHTTRRPKSRLLGLAVTAVAAISIAGLAPAAEASPAHNNTDPYSTGCNSGASLIHTYYTSGGRFDMFYSGTCQTNWIQWTGPNVCTWKRVQSPYGSWTQWEKDKATWSYSMQIYAPGSSTVDVEWAVGSPAYGNGTCDGGAWDYAHDVGRHGWYSVS